MTFLKMLIVAAMLSPVTRAISTIETPASFRPVAVIELFTSQGCSSCPAADRLLTKTVAEAKKTSTPLLALSFHVDYWNRLGWTDPFSDKKYAERQKQYATQFGLGSIYTPQAIVNGKQEFVGSDEQKLNTAIKASLSENSTVQFKTIDVKIQPDHSAKVNFSLEGSYTGCNINLALVSLSEITSIKRGENSGVTLLNENVVRQFISIPATTNGAILFNASPLPAENNRAVIAYIQRRNNGKIIGGVIADHF